MSYAYSLVLYCIGDEFGRYQRLGYFYLLADNLSGLQGAVGCVCCFSEDEDFAEIIIDGNGKRQRIVYLV
jgi:hypothetical protein